MVRHFVPYLHRHTAILLESTLALGAMRAKATAAPIAACPPTLSKPRPMSSADIANDPAAMDLTRVGQLLVAGGWRGAARTCRLDR
jgi:hypothetical protein